MIIKQISLALAILTPFSIQANRAIPVIYDTDSDVLTVSPEERLRALSNGDIRCNAYKCYLHIILKDRENYIHERQNEYNLEGRGYNRIKEIKTLDNKIQKITHIVKTIAPLIGYAPEFFLQQTDDQTSAFIHGREERDQERVSSR